MNLKEIFTDKKIAGELIKNIGLGIFVNAIYGISDGSVEFFNFIDIIVGIVAMLIGIIVERK